MAEAGRKPTVSYGEETRKKLTMAFRPLRTGGAKLYEGMAGNDVIASVGGRVSWRFAEPPQQERVAISW